MSRKILVAILTLALTLALAAPAAFAAETKSNGDIGFNVYDDTDDGITDEDDDDIPDDFWDTVSKTRDLDFGTVDASLDNTDYTSVNDAGLAVKCGSDTWTVTVGIDDFYLLDAAGDKTTAKTLNGFTLTLTPDTSSITEIGIATIAPVAQPIDTTTTGNIATGTKGISGCNYTGTLSVVGGTAIADTEAQAELTWNFVAA